MAVAAEVGRLCIPLLLVFPRLGSMQRATCESLQFFRVAPVDCNVDVATTQTAAPSRMSFLIMPM